MFSDATTYAHFLFNAFDMDRNGSIRFEVSSPDCMFVVETNKKRNLIINLLISFTGFCDRTVCVAQRLCYRETQMGVQPVWHQQRRLHHQRGTSNEPLWEDLPKYVAVSSFLSGFLQEMMAIMTSIYDMMGRYTLPSVRDDSPYEHVEKFFQVQYVISATQGCHFVTGDIRA